MGHDQYCDQSQREDQKIGGVQALQNDLCSRGLSLGAVSAARVEPHACNTQLNCRRLRKEGPVIAFEKSLAYTATLASYMNPPPS